MTNTRKREMACKYAWSLLHKPYLWGGDDPLSGFDCSGFVVEVLKSIGKVAHDYDANAERIWNDFRGNRVDYHKSGCLVFFGRDRITHVELLISDELALGASGGGRNTTSTGVAINQNAYIKLRPLGNHRQIIGFVDPFMEV